jgi:hypothetical protein
MQMDNALLTNRMIRAAKLESNLYEEVERDQSATAQALTVVIAVAIAQGLGSGIGALMAGRGLGNFVLALIGGIILGIIGWVVWSALVYFVGTSLFGGRATLGEVLRTVGFAYTPNVLAIVSFIPILGGLIAFVASIWALIALIIGIRQALDFSTGKAVITALVAWIVMVIVIGILGGIVGLGALGAGLLMGS